MSIFKQRHAVEIRALLWYNCEGLNIKLLMKTPRARIERERVNELLSTRLPDLFASPAENTLKTLFLSGREFTNASTGGDIDIEARNCADPDLTIARIKLSQFVTRSGFTCIASLINGNPDRNAHSEVFFGWTGNNDRTDGFTVSIIPGYRNKPFAVSLDLVTEEFILAQNRRIKFGSPDIESILLAIQRGNGGMVIDRLEMTNGQFGMHIVRFPPNGSEKQILVPGQMKVNLSTQVAFD